MKKKLYMFTCLLLISVSLSACGKIEAPDYSEYQNQMDNFFTGVSTLDEEINELNPTDETSITTLFEYLDELEGQFKYFSEIEVPEDFQVTESLADEAYDYMKQANEYFRQSFSGNTYNEYTWEAGMECYERANKRMQYVIDIIHGKLPEDENITFE